MHIHTIYIILLICIRTNIVAIGVRVKQYNIIVLLLAVMNDDNNSKGQR